MKIRAIYKIKHRDEVREFDTPEEAQAEWKRIYEYGGTAYEHCNMHTRSTVPMYLESNIVMYNGCFKDLESYGLQTEFCRAS